MDMWNWLQDCYEKKCLTLEDLEKVMIDDIEAEYLWEDWALNSNEFIDVVRDEVRPFIKYIKEKEKLEK